jgi:hypothetical protein
MRVAAAVFMVGGLAYLALDVGLMLSAGFHLGNLFMGLVALAVIYQGYALFQMKKGARWTGFITAAVIACSSGYIASVLVAPGFPETLYASRRFIAHFRCACWRISGVRSHSTANPVFEPCALTTRSTGPAGTGLLLGDRQWRRAG